MENHAPQKLLNVLTEVVSVATNTDLDISLFHRFRESATCYFLFNLQGKNAQICADFPSIKTLRKTLTFEIILIDFGI